MYTILSKTHLKIIRKSISTFVAFALTATLVVPPSLAQVIQPAFGLSPAFQPILMKGMMVDPMNPLIFDFVIDQGQKEQDAVGYKEESLKLVKYFMASLTIPNNDAWVNLSPYEQDRIIPESLGQTEMGRQMLEQDYILKQLSASLTNPETELGKKYWEEVNKRTLEKKSPSIQPPTANVFTKVWIVPGTADVFEKDGFAYITASDLKVMMEEDYEAMARSAESSNSAKGEALAQSGERKAESNDVSEVANDVFRRLILPQLEKEVNEGKNFAPIRQLYQSVILATWYKQALKDSLLGRIYADKSKVVGIESGEQNMKERVYAEYLAAFKQGVYSLIKEETGPDGELIPRKYFSGGENMTNIPLRVDRSARGSSAVFDELKRKVSLGMVRIKAAEPSESKSLRSKIVPLFPGAKRNITPQDLADASISAIDEKKKSLSDAEIVLQNAALEAMKPDAINAVIYQARPFLEMIALKMGMLRLNEVEEKARDEAQQKQALTDYEIVFPDMVSQPQFENIKNLNAAQIRQQILEEARKLSREQVQALTSAQMVVLTSILGYGFVPQDLYAVLQAPGNRGVPPVDPQFLISEYDLLKGMNEYRTLFVGEYRALLAIFGMELRSRQVRVFNPQSSRYEMVTENYFAGDLRQVVKSLNANGFLTHREMTSMIAVGPIKLERQSKFMRALESKFESVMDRLVSVVGTGDQFLQADMSLKELIVKVSGEGVTEQEAAFALASLGVVEFSRNARAMVKIEPRWAMSLADSRYTDIHLYGEKWDVMPDVALRKMTTHPRAKWAMYAVGSESFEPKSATWYFDRSDLRYPYESSRTVSDALAKTSNTEVAESSDPSLRLVRGEQIPEVPQQTGNQFFTESMQTRLVNYLTLQFMDFLKSEKGQSFAQALKNLPKGEGNPLNPIDIAARLWTHISLAKPDAIVPGNAMFVSALLPENATGLISIENLSEEKRALFLQAVGRIMRSSQVSANLVRGDLANDKLKAMIRDNPILAVNDKFAELDARYRLGISLDSGKEKVFREKMAKENGSLGTGADFELNYQTQVKARKEAMNGKLQRYVNFLKLQFMDFMKYSSKSPNAEKFKKDMSQVTTTRGRSALEMASRLWAFLNLSKPNDLMPGSIVRVSTIVPETKEGTPQIRLMEKQAFANFSEGTAWIMRMPDNFEVRKQLADANLTALIGQMTTAEIATKFKEMEARYRRGFSLDSVMNEVVREDLYKVALDEANRAKQSAPTQGSESAVVEPAVSQAPAEAENIVSTTPVEAETPATEIEIVEPVDNIVFMPAPETETFFAVPSANAAASPVMERYLRLLKLQFVQSAQGEQFKRAAPIEGRPTALKIASQLWVFIQMAKPETTIPGTALRVSSISPVNQGTLLKLADLRPEQIANFNSAVWSIQNNAMVNVIVEDQLSDVSIVKMRTDLEIIPSLAELDIRYQAGVSLNASNKDVVRQRLLEAGEDFLDDRIVGRAYEARLSARLEELRQSTNESGIMQSRAVASSAADNVGGINLNPALINLQIKRDGSGVPLPMPQQNLEQIDIPGLFPVIINIQPFNMNMVPVLSESEKSVGRG